MNQPQRLELVAGHWYAWQMLPGYFGYPYCSPIRVERIRPHGTGRSILTLEFWNLGYAEGVQGFSTDLRVRTRTSEFIYADIVDPNGSGETRGAVITALSVEWVERFCTPGALDHLPADARTQLRLPPRGRN